MNIESKVFEDVTILNIILNKAVKNVFRFDSGKLDYILSKVVRSGFRTVIIK